MQGRLLIFLLGLATAADAACTNNTNLSRQTTGICFTQISEMTFYARDHRLDTNDKASNGTACLWFKTSVDDSGSGILSGRNGEIGLNFTENVGFTFIPARDEIRLNVFGLQVAFDVYLERSVWYHLCFSWEGESTESTENTLKMYVNMDFKNVTEMADGDGRNSSNYVVTNCFDRLGLWTPELTLDEILADACGRHVPGNTIQPEISWCNDNTQYINYEYIATQETHQVLFCNGRNKRQQEITQSTTATQSTLSTSRNSNTASSSQGTSSSQITGSSPGTTETSRQTTETNAQTTETNTRTTETNTRTTETNPRTTEASPRTTETNPRTTETNPRTTETNPITTETNPRTTETNPRTTETNSRTTETNPRTTETNTRTTETNPPTTETNPRTTETNSQTTQTSPQTTASIPQTTASNPQTTASNPQTTASNPQTTASGPQTTASSPGNTAFTPRQIDSSPPTTGSSPPTTGSSPPTTGSSPQTTIPSFNITSVCNQQMPFLNRIKDIFCNLLWIYDEYPRYLGTPTPITTPRT